MPFNVNSDFTDGETEPQKDIIIFPRPMQQDSDKIA